MKRLIQKILILLLVFAAIVGIHALRSDKETDNQEVVREPNLPVVYLTYGGERVNPLYGYTVEMDTPYMRDVITPMGEDRRLRLQIQCYDNSISNIRYEVTSMDGEHFIEDTILDSWKTEEDVCTATLNITNMIEAEQEYMLTLMVSTEKHSDIRYYTRFIQTSEDYTKQIKFVYDMNVKTFTKGNVEQLGKYLEPTETMDNSNLGHVTINSSYEQFTWGKLTPEWVSDPVITMKELIGNIGCYELSYRVRAKNDYDTMQYYYVREYYRVMFKEGARYLLSFNRTMDQIFEPSTQSVTTARMNLGIDSDLKVEYAYSPDYKWIAFENTGSLWCMDTSENKIRQLFSFVTKQEEDTDERNYYLQHDIQIIDVDDNGNVDFLVCGYMNNGIHEGTAGISFYRYRKKRGYTEELAFIPSTRPYQMLQETLGKLSFVNDNNVLYVMLDDCIYSIDLTGEEYALVVDGLTDDNYVISDSGKKIAWQEGDTIYNASTVKIFNVESGQEYSIAAPENTCIRVLGFIKDDFSYGLARKEDITTDKNGNITFPMYQIQIVDGAYQEVMTYPVTKQENVYVTDVEPMTNMLSLKRVKKRGNVFQAYDDDQLSYNGEEEKSAVTLSTIVTDLKKTEVVLQYAYKIDTANKLKQVTIGEKVVDSSQLSERTPGEDTKYYVYGNGEVLGSFHNLVKAIALADDCAGVVVNASNDYIWARADRVEEMQIEEITIEEAANTSGQLVKCIESMLHFNGTGRKVASLMREGKTTLDILNEALDNRGLDLTGCSFDQIMYYVAKQQPVLAMLDNSRCMLIIGYNHYNAVLADPETGTIYKNGVEETEAMFKKAGSRYIGILP